MNSLKCASCGKFTTVKGSKVKLDTMSGYTDPHGMCNLTLLCLNCYKADIQRDLDLAATSGVYAEYLGQDKIAHLKKLLGELCSQTSVLCVP